MIIVDNLEYLSSYYSCSSRRLHPHRSIYVSLLSYSLSLVVRMCESSRRYGRFNTRIRHHISRFPDFTRTPAACPGLALGRF